jgi:hypothetical protein
MSGNKSRTSSLTLDERNRRRVGTPQSSLRLRPDCRLCCSSARENDGAARLLAPRVHGPLIDAPRRGACTRDGEAQFSACSVDDRGRPCSRRRPAHHRPSPAERLFWRSDTAEVTRWPETIAATTVGYEGLHGIW